MFLGLKFLASDVLLSIRFYPGSGCLGVLAARQGLFYPVSGWFGRVGVLSEGVLSSRWVFWALNVREALFSSTVWMFWAS